MRGEVRPERRTGGVRLWGGGDASGTHAGRARLKASGGQGTRGAHVEHGMHVRDLGRFEAQRLVERLRTLPSRNEGIRRGAWAGMRDGVWGAVAAQAGCTGKVRLKAGGQGHARCGPEAGVRRTAAAQAACTGRARLKAGGQGTRGAHVEHLMHQYDLGRVEAQRLVERPRVLPSRKEDFRCGARCGQGGERA